MVTTWSPEQRYLLKGSQCVRDNPLIMRHGTHAQCLALTRCPPQDCGCAPPAATMTVVVTNEAPQRASSVQPLLLHAHADDVSFLSLQPRLASRCNLSLRHQKDLRAYGGRCQRQLSQAGCPWTHRPTGIYSGRAPVELWRQGWTLQLIRTRS